MSRILRMLASRSDIVAISASNTASSGSRRYLVCGSKKNKGTDGAKVRTKNMEIYEGASYEQIMLLKIRGLAERLVGD